MSASLRKAALTLHGLSETDRSWMLDRLPEPARQALEKLIAELEDLGFASEAWPLLEAASDFGSEEMAPPAPVKTAEQIVDDVVMRIERCPLPILLDWVNEEAEWLVAQVLAQRKWSWTESLLERLRADKKNRLLKMPREIVIVPGPVSARLLARLADRLESKTNGVSENIAADGAGHEPGGRTAQVKKWLRSFVRRG